jgi:hypothetical protein
MKAASICNIPRSRKNVTLSRSFDIIVDSPTEFSSRLDPKNGKLPAYG